MLRTSNPCHPWLMNNHCPTVVTLCAVMMIAMMIAMMTSGCVQVEGGAVAGRWDLRFPDGRRVDDNDEKIKCNESGLDRMTFSLIPAGDSQDPCFGAEHCQFDCAPQGRGITEFMIPEGQYAISMQILDIKGEIMGPADGIVTPAPIVRQVRTGEITDLSVNLIIVDRK